MKKILLACAFVMLLTGVSYGQAEPRVFNSLERVLTVLDVDKSFSLCFIEARYASTEALLPTVTAWESLGEFPLVEGWGQGPFLFREFSTLFYSEWRYSVDGGASWCVHPEALNFDLRDKCGSSRTD